MKHLKWKGAVHMPWTSCRECKAAFRIDRGQEGGVSDVRRSLASNYSRQNCAVRSCLEFPKRSADVGVLHRGFYGGRAARSFPFRVLSRARYFSPTGNTVRSIDLPRIQPHRYQPGWLTCHLSGTAYLTRYIDVIVTNAGVTMSCQSAPPG